MLKICKYSVLFCVPWVLDCGTIFIFGKWYTPGPLKEGKQDFEDITKIGWEDRNLLFDEDTDIFYVNNFWPILKKEHNINGKEVRELGDIFVAKGLLKEESLDKLRQPIPATEEEAVAYWETLNWYIKLVIKYLEAFNLEDAKQRMERIYEISNQPYSKPLLIRAISELQKLRIFNCMHTERLLIFDKFYEVVYDEKKEVHFAECFFDSQASLVFVSHYDMCEVCERLMEEILPKMERIAPARFMGATHYKILIGSFFSYHESRNVDGADELLKVPLCVDPDKRNKRTRR